MFDPTIYKVSPFVDIDVPMNLKDRNGLTIPFSVEHIQGPACQHVFEFNYNGTIQKIPFMASYVEVNCNDGSRKLYGNPWKVTAREGSMKHKILMELFHQNS